MSQILATDRLPEKPENVVGKSNTNTMIITLVVLIVVIVIVACILYFRQAKKLKTLTLQTATK